MTGERKIPKEAAKALAEFSQKLSVQTGKTAAQIFKEFLELMKKYGDYFFSEPWPKKLDKHFEVDDADYDFVNGAKNYSEERERFIVLCLKRNISLEGFNSEGFEEDFDWYGKAACWDCAVPDAVWLREHIKKLEETIRKNDEEMKSPKPPWIVRKMDMYYRKPNVVRENKMKHVKLRLYEKLGLAEGKSCDVNNKYKCPYGKQADELIENGRIAKFIWDIVWWYDFHWNPSDTFRPSANDMKWYHYGEPSIIDVTDYNDILRAVEDGRLERIIEERKRYKSEYKG